MSYLLPDSSVIWRGLFQILSIHHEFSLCVAEGGTLTTGSYRVLIPMHDIKYCNCEAGSLPPDQSLRSPSFSLCRRLHHPAEIEMGKYLKNCRIVLYTFLSQKVYYILWYHAWYDNKRNITINVPNTSNFAFDRKWLFYDTVKSNDKTDDCRK